MKHCPNPRCDHLVRSGRIAEFVDSVETCVDCGTRLAHGEPPPAPPREYRSLVTVYRTGDPVQAHLVRSALEEQQIPAHVSGETLQGASSVVPIQVMVPAEDRERAARIVEELDGPEDGWDG